MTRVRGAGHHEGHDQSAGESCRDQFRQALIMWGFHIRHGRGVPGVVAFQGLAVGWQDFNRLIPHQVVHVFIHIPQRFTRHDAEVDKRFRFGGQHVLGASGFDNRRGSGGAGERVGERLRGKFALQSAAEKPGVGVLHALGERHSLAQKAGDEAHYVKGLGEWVGFQHGNGEGNRADGCVFGRGGGMTAFDLGFQFEAEISFFTDANLPDRAFEAQQTAFGDHAAFIQHKSELHAAFLKQTRDGARAIQTRDFLIRAEGEVNCAPGDETGAQQVVHCLADANQRAFAVQGAAPPYISVGKLAGKGRMRPAAFRGFIRGDHVLMRRETNRAEGWVGALPCEE